MWLYHGAQSDANVHRNGGGISTCPEKAAALGPLDREVGATVGRHRKGLRCCNELGSSPKPSEDPSLGRAISHLPALAASAGPTGGRTHPLRILSHIQQFNLQFSKRKLKVLGIN